MNKYDLLNKSILYTVNRYIESACSEGLEPSKLHCDIRFATKVFMTSNALTEYDMEGISKIAKDEEFGKVINRSVSFYMFTLELMKLWVENIPKEYRPMLNISDKRLSKGRAMYAISMLRLKQKDSEKYNEMSAIINDSIDTAKDFFEYHVNNVVVE